MDNIKTVCLPSEFYRVTSGSFDLLPSQSVFQGSFANNIRFNGPRFMQWRCELQSTVQTREQWQKYQAWRARNISGPTAFEMYDPGKELPLGVGAGFDPSGTPPGFADPDASVHYFDGPFYDGPTFLKVKTNAPRKANILLVKDAPASSVILKSGDHFSVGHNLYMVTGDVRSDASGDAAITFSWRLHKPALAGDLVTLRNPSGRFIMVDMNSGQVARELAGLGSFQLMAVEFPYT